MQSIPLTQKNKEKLLEMCINLYQNDKRFNHISILQNNHVKFFNDAEFFKHRLFSKSKVKSYKLKGTVSIHWFEFVLLHLLPKLNRSIRDMQIEMGKRGLSYIDYCYWVFKQG